MELENQVNSIPMYFCLNSILKGAMKYEMEKIYYKNVTRHNEKGVKCPKQCFRNVTFLKNFMFEHHVPDIFHVLNFTFWKHFILWKSHFWNISSYECHISEIFHVLSVTFLEHSMFWTSRFRNISSSEHNISETFHVSNVTFLEHFIF